MKYLSEFLWTHSLDVSILVPDKSKFLNFNCTYLCISWIQLVTSYHYCHSCGPPSETSGLVIYMQDDVTVLSRRVKFDLTDSCITEIYECKVSVGK